MGDPEATKTDEGAFPGIFGLQTGEEEGESNKEKPAETVETVKKEELETLKGELEEFKKSAPNPEQLQNIIENNKKMEALQEVFLPNKDKATEEERKKLLNEFDAAPIEFLNNFIDKKIAIVSEKQVNSDVQYFADKVMAEIDKEFKIDWEKDGHKIAAEMTRFTVEEKRKDPKGTTIRAMQLAKVGEKRKSSLPYLESSDYSEIQQKAREDESTAYKKRLRAAAQQMGQNPLKGFWESDSK